MNWNLIVADPARKELSRLPPHYRDRILAALRDMADDPHSGDVARLRDIRFAWRRRVGDYRIIFDLDPAARRITVQHIARRTSTTYRKG
jgi:mRNA interferase RelE/StbE